MGVSCGMDGLDLLARVQVVQPAGRRSQPALPGAPRASPGASTPRASRRRGWHSLPPAGSATPPRAAAGSAGWSRGRPTLASSPARSRAPARRDGRRRSAWLASVNATLRPRRPQGACSCAAGGERAARHPRTGRSGRRVPAGPPLSEALERRLGGGVLHGAPSLGVLLGPLRERPKQLGPARDTIGVVAQAQAAARQTGVDLGPQFLAGVLARAEAGPVPDLVDGGPVVGLPAGEPLRTGQLNAVPPEVVAGAARGRDSDPGDVRFCPGLRVMPNALMTMHLTDSNCLIANRYAVPATLPPRGAHQPPSASSSICASSGSSRFAARTTRGRRSSRCRSQGA